MNSNETTPIKLNTNAILKMLPEGFTAVKIPNKTRIVYIEADATKISGDDAIAAVKKLAKDFKFSVAYNYIGEDFHNFGLEDPAFNKEMRAKAKECLKVVKDFYKKYRIAYRYDDVACGTVRHIIRIVNNDE